MHNPPAAKTKRSSRFSAVRWPAFGLALVAALLSAYLTFTPADQLIGCDAATGAGCSEVLQTRWSRWFGLPVSGAGMLVYAAIALLLALPRAAASRAVATTLLGLGTMAVASGVWFIGLQLFEVRALCPFCFTIHTLGLGVFILLCMGLLGAGPGTSAGADGRPARPLPLPLAAGGIFFGLLFTAALVAGQVQTRFDVQLQVVDRSQTIVSPGAPSRPLSQPPAQPLAANPEIGQAAPSAAASQPPSSLAGSAAQAGQEANPEAARIASLLAAAHAHVPPRPVSLLDGRLNLTLGEYPVLGDPDAPHVIAVMFDYTCPACRRMHADLTGILERHPGRLAIVLFPMPLDSSCNPSIERTSYGHRNACLFGRLALAVWNTRPEAFAAFDRAMFAPEFPPSADQAWRIAGDLVGELQIQAAMQEPLFEKMLQFSINLFYTPLVEEKVLPVLMTPGQARLGNPDTPEELYQFLEEQLGPLDAASSEATAEPAQ